MSLTDCERVHSPKGQAAAAAAATTGNVSRIFSLGSTTVQNVSRQAWTTATRRPDITVAMSGTPAGARADPVLASSVKRQTFNYGQSAASQLAAAPRLHFATEGDKTDFFNTGKEAAASFNYLYVTRFSFSPRGSVTLWAGKETDRSLHSSILSSGIS